MGKRGFGVGIKKRGLEWFGFSVACNWFTELEASKAWELECVVESNLCVCLDWVCGIE